MGEITDAPIALLYIAFAVITLGVGVAVLVYQTGATDQAFVQRRGMLIGGVLLVLVGGGVLLAQVAGVVLGSYNL